MDLTSHDYTVNDEVTKVTQPGLKVLSTRAAPDLPHWLHRTGSVAMDPRAQPGRAQLQGVDLREADLTNADLSTEPPRRQSTGVWLQETRLDEANLAGADFTGAQMCDLSLHE